MNTVTAILNTVLDALSMAFGAITTTMIQNVHATEWTVGLLLILSVWLLVSRRGNSALGFAFLLLAVGAGAWLSWKTGHTGASVQQVTLAILSLHGLLRARGWALIRKYSK